MSTTTIDRAAREVVDQGGRAALDKTIAFKVSTGEKEEVRAAAETLGLSMSQYLLELHRAAYRRINRR